MLTFRDNTGSETDWDQEKWKVRFRQKEKKSSVQTCPSDSADLTRLGYNTAVPVAF